MQHSKTLAGSVLTKVPLVPRVRTRYELNGTSPRAWGELRPIIGSVRGNRNIPTGVGRTRANKEKQTRIPEHPHGRGENFIQLELFPVSSGAFAGSVPTKAPLVPESRTRRIHKTSPNTLTVEGFLQLKALHLMPCNNLFKFFSVHFRPPRPSHAAWPHPRSAATPPCPPRPQASPPPCAECRQTPRTFLRKRRPLLHGLPFLDL